MEDIVIDPLAMTVGADPQAIVITLETISRIRDEFNLNMTLGASNTSFGLPSRHALNAAFSCSPRSRVSPARSWTPERPRPSTPVVPRILLGRDEWGMAWIAAHRQAQAAAAS